MPPTEARANLLLDATVRMLGIINSTTGPNDWWNTPKVIGSDPTISELEHGPRPGLYVMTGRYQPKPGMGGEHELELQLLVVCVTEANDGQLPTRVLNRLAHDVMKAVEQTEKLVAEDLTTILAHFIEVVGYEPEVELMRSSTAGLATVELLASGIYWTH